VDTVTSKIHIRKIQETPSSDFKNHLQFGNDEKNTNGSYLSPSNNQDPFLSERLGDTLLSSAGQRMNPVVSPSQAGVTALFNSSSTDP